MVRFLDLLAEHQRAGRAADHAFPAGDATRRPHRIVEVEADPGCVALASAPDDHVLLDVGAGADAPVAEDALVVVNGDPRRRGILPARGLTQRDPGRADQRPARHNRRRIGLGRGGVFKGPPLLSQPVEPPGEPAELVGGERRLPVGREAIGDEHVDERPHLVVDPPPRGEVGGGDRLHLHRLLDAVLAGGEELAFALHRAALHLRDFHAAHPADADGVEVLLMAEDRDRIAPGNAFVELRGGVEDRRRPRDRSPFAVAQNLPLRIGEGHGLGDGHLLAVDADRDLPLEVGRRHLVHADELAVEVAGKQPVLLDRDREEVVVVVGRRHVSAHRSFLRRWRSTSAGKN